MAVVDARAEGLSVGRLFRDLRLVQLNSILCSDLSERECAYNAGTIDETDPEKVPPLPLECVCVLGDGNVCRRCFRCCRLSSALAT
jgi:hypothetical protein